MLDFLYNNWKWLLAAIGLVSLVLLVMSASKRKDSDMVDSLDESNEPPTYNEWGVPESKNRA